MKSFYTLFLGMLLIFSVRIEAQHHVKMKVALDNASQKMTIVQEIVYFNQSQDTLDYLVLNDWTNAYSSKTSPLAKRFSDEFYRGFQLSKTQERGGTFDLVLTDENGKKLDWNRNLGLDLLAVILPQKLAPNQKLIIKLNYSLKIPSDAFTQYGVDKKGNFSLKNWYISPARYENKAFVKNSNFDTDDCANALCNFEISLQLPDNYQVTSDLETTQSSRNNFDLNGNFRTDFGLYLEPKNSFISYKNDDVTVLTNLKDYKTTEIDKAIAIDKVVVFAATLLGNHPNSKIIVSQQDYARNPFYGLNQLPSFLAPFPDNFLFELKFLKTYLNNYLKNTLHLDPRKDNWIFDGIQVYAMMQYMDQNYPDAKMMGRLSQFKLLKGYHLANLDFNEQYSYFYLLMARKNLDQPLSTLKNNLIKFNQQIANKYRAGLSFIYLDNFIGNNFIKNNLPKFINQNKNQQTSRNDFENLLKVNTNQNLDWFFKTIVDTNQLIDFKLKKVSQTQDSVRFILKNKYKTQIPISVFGIKKDSIVFKSWIFPKNNDSVYSVLKNQADKLVINYNNEIPEFNLRNNYKKLNGFFPNNRPIKLALIDDLENPKYNQLIYSPIISYNLYDGISPGIRLENKAILNRNFVFDLNPVYALKSRKLTGSTVFAYTQLYRNTSLSSVRYSFSSNYFHYAPDAAYLRLNPMITMQLRDIDLRKNYRQNISLRNIIVKREPSKLLSNDASSPNYSVLNLKYSSAKTELTQHFGFVADVQFSSSFGKINAQLQHRNLFDDNRQFNLRLYAGHFLYNRRSTDYFSFALDRPTDYLFDYGYIGRSSSTGLASQEYILAEGGFKSKLKTPYANKWLTSINASYSIWNWVEVYSDFALLKNNKFAHAAFDSGIRLNLLPDYFELYLPIYSNNGWEIVQPSYRQKIRFIITLEPKRLTSLFTRKWF